MVQTRWLAQERGTRAESIGRDAMADEDRTVRAPKEVLRDHL